MSLPPPRERGGVVSLAKLGRGKRMAFHLAFPLAGVVSLVKPGRGKTNPGEAKSIREYFV
jgi:hypothetical protein